MHSNKLLLLKNKKNTIISNYASYTREWSKVGNIINNNNKLNIIDITFNHECPPIDSIIYKGTPIKINNNYEKKIEYFNKYFEILEEKIKLEEYDVIIELGSGWGRNIYYMLQKNIINNQRIISGEFNKTGCIIQESIKNNFFKNQHLNIYHFDYKNSNNFFDQVKKIEKPFQKCLVFTKHSIEQITEIDNDFFDNLLQICPQIKCIHFEPIGWQISEKSFCKSSNYYNRNLFSKLEEYQNKNLIKIKNVELDFLSVTRPGNTSTLIEWDKI